MARELDLIDGRTVDSQWQSPTGELFNLVIPHTVYPPREDTTFVAKNIQRLGAGKNRKCLEIGVGSGVLSLFCHRQGWRVSACDINPYAVATATQFLFDNGAYDVKVREGGPGPFVDGEVKQWAGDDDYDLVFWNMPYIIPKDGDDQTLGPMEDAALVDTSDKNLLTQTLAKLCHSKLLRKHGIGLFTVSTDISDDELIGTCARYGFAARTVDELKFTEGESLKLLACWHPFANYPTKFREVVASTNSALISGNWPTGSSLSARHQTHGRGRYDRQWINSGELLACSWKVDLPDEIAPEVVQIILGNVVKQTLDDLADVNSFATTILKWPNDVLVRNGSEIGKVSGILVESISKGNSIHTVIGIGINICPDSEAANHNFPMAYADSLSDSINFNKLQSQLHCRIAGLFESIDGIVKSDFNPAKISAFEAVKEGFIACQPIFYRNNIVTFKHMNNDGSVLMADADGFEFQCDEGDHLQWNFS